MGVSTMPGATAFTRMPCAYSIASPRVTESSPPLVRLVSAGRDSGHRLLRQRGRDRDDLSAAVLLHVAYSFLLHVEDPERLVETTRLKSSGV